MKMIAQFAVVLAVLLLLTGVASAQWCECYEVTCTNVETGDKITHNVGMCFAPWDNEGMFNGICGTCGPMPLFWDTRLRALAYTIDNPYASLEFHGGISGVTGIVECYGDRWEMRGHIVDEENCSLLPPCGLIIIDEP